MDREVKREGGRIVSRSSRARSPSPSCRILGSIDDHRPPLLSPVASALVLSLVKVGPTTTYLHLSYPTQVRPTACQKGATTTAAIGATLKDKNGPPERWKQPRRRRRGRRGERHLGAAPRHFPLECERRKGRCKYDFSKKIFLPPPIVMYRIM